MKRIGSFRTTAFLGALALVLTVAPVLADEYCSVPQVYHQPGNPTAMKMKVVVQSVARVQEKWRKRTEWCGFGVGTASQYPISQPIEVLQKPHAGEVRTTTYTIAYRGSKVGSDSFAFRLHQVDPRNNSALVSLVTVDVEVVATTF